MSERRPAAQMIEAIDAATLDDALRIDLGTRNGRIGGHTVEHAAALGVDKHADTRRTDDIFQEVELLIETGRALLRHAPEEADGGRFSRLCLTDDILKRIYVHVEQFFE